MKKYIPFIIILLIISGCSKKDAFVGIPVYYGNAHNCVHTVFVFDFSNNSMTAYDEVNDIDDNGNYFVTGYSQEQHEIHITGNANLEILFNGNKYPYEIESVDGEYLMSGSSPEFYGLLTECDQSEISNFKKILSSNG